MSQKLTQILQSEIMGNSFQNENRMISKEFQDLFNKCGEKPTKKTMVKKTPNKKQTIKESIVCKYGFLIRMNNQLGFKVIKGSYLK